MATDEEKVIPARGDQQMCFEGGCGSHEPRKAGGHWKPGRKGSGSSGAPGVVVVGGGGWGDWPCPHLGFSSRNLMFDF